MTTETTTAPTVPPSGQQLAEPGSPDDEEVAAFLADARAALAPTAQSPLPLVPVPDLFDMTGAPDEPTANLFNASSWSMAEMKAELRARARRDALAIARRAGEMQRTGEGVKPWHRCIESAVLCELAAAEEAAPTEDRPWHAARLDAYSAAYGMKGWYRWTDDRGQHQVQCSRVRTAADGDEGRYALIRDTHAKEFIVRDMDVHPAGGRADVFTTTSRHTAQQWIDRKVEASLAAAPTP